MELYVHIPFCRKKCRYCSFVSFTEKESDYEAYIDLLLKEAEWRADEAEEPVRTVYIGGGTPSLLPPRLFNRLIRGLDSIYDFSSVSEFTSEANPGTVTKAWLDNACELGINRLSFGMQAAQDSLLLILGRIHHQEDVIRSVELARQSGITNINLDLIFGIPSQTEENWIETLRTAVELKPAHISAYGLIPEEGTPLYEDLRLNRLQLPDTDTERNMYSSAVSFLWSMGLKRYEISNFATPGFECLHNIGYWTQVPYIGLGISAASMTRLRALPDGVTYIRRTNPDSWPDYAEMIRNRISPPDEIISCQEARFESVMLGFRLAEGINEDTFMKMHKVSLEESYGNRLKPFVDNGLIIHEGKQWRMSERGLDIQNAILSELMDD